MIFRAQVDLLSRLLNELHVGFENIHCLLCSLKGGYLGTFLRLEFKESIVVFFVVFARFWRLVLLNSIEFKRFYNW